MGIDKLLGKGTITQPLMIKVESHSEKAREKVAEAGGQIISLSEE
jgi:ribosomal protein L15